MAPVGSLFPACLVSSSPFGSRSAFLLPHLYLVHPRVLHLGPQQHHASHRRGRCPRNRNSSFFPFFLHHLYLLHHCPFILSISDSPQIPVFPTKPPNPLSLPLAWLPVRALLRLSTILFSTQACLVWRPIFSSVCSVNLLRDEPILTPSLPSGNCTVFYLPPPEFSILFLNHLSSFFPLKTPYLPACKNDFSNRNHVVKQQAFSLLVPSFSDQASARHQMRRNLPATRRDT